MRFDATLALQSQTPVAVAQLESLGCDNGLRGRTETRFQGQPVGAGKARC
jgi:hypothetical protein